MNFSAVILAGGQSSRMGCEKAFLDVGGQTLLARQVKTVRSAGAAETFISGRANVDYSSFGCRVLADRFPDAGPLAGIEAALNVATQPWLLVLAVDLPAMSATLLRQLTDVCTPVAGVVPLVNGYIEPLAAFYPVASRGIAQHLLNEGKLAVGGFAEACGQAGLIQIQTLPASAGKSFANWNYPADVNPVPTLSDGP